MVDLCASAKLYRVLNCIESKKVRHSVSAEYLIKKLINK